MRPTRRSHRTGKHSHYDTLQATQACSLLKVIKHLDVHWIPP